MGAAALALRHGHVQRRLRGALPTLLRTLREHRRGARGRVALDDRDRAAIGHLDRAELDGDVGIVRSVLTAARDLGTRDTRPDTLGVEHQLVDLVGRRSDVEFVFDDHPMQSRRDTP